METMSFDANALFSLVIISTFLLMPVVFILFLIAQIRFRSNTDEIYDNPKAADALYQVMPSLYEMILSSICSFGAFGLYYLLNDLMKWNSSGQQYSGFFLLVSISLSIKTNDILDKYFIQITLEEDRSTLRLLSSITVIGMIIYLINRLPSIELNNFLIGYTLLVAARFIYFDTTKKQLRDIIKVLFRHSYLSAIIIFYFIGVIHYALKDCNIQNTNPLYLYIYISFAMIASIWECQQVSKFLLYY